MKKFYCMYFLCRRVITTNYPQLSCMLHLLTFLTFKITIKSNDDDVWQKVMFLHNEVQVNKFIEIKNNKVVRKITLLLLINAWGTTIKPFLRQNLSDNSNFNGQKSILVVSTHFSKNQSWMPPVTFPVKKWHLAIFPHLKGWGHL